MRAIDITARDLAQVLGRLSKAPIEAAVRARAERLAAERRAEVGRANESTDAVPAGSDAP